MKPESIKFLHQIKSRAGHIPDVYSLVNSILYEEGHAMEISKCPSCGSDWIQMEKDLKTSSEWVGWDSTIGIPHGFPGKSEARVSAELLIAKCSLCARQFQVE